MHSTWTRFDYYRGPVGRFLLLSSFAFDSSVAGIFWTLGQGGCLLLPEESALQDAEPLVEAIEREAVTHLLCLPSLHRLILERRGSRLGSLRVVIVAGEACPSGLVSQHHEALPQVSLFNEYGPTEGTVWSSVDRLQPEDARAAIPIGRPIRNTQIYLLDGQRNSVPVGVVGELYIGGVGLARGYLNRPELTAERFIANPYSNRAGERLYRTGDLACYRPDGNIEYVGRIDHQVKIRGYRIELREVAVALSRHPRVKEAVVIAREDIPADQRLVAYVVGEEQAPAVEELRVYLKEALPEYMVPSAFVFLECLPLTPNGKVDRKRLPAPNIEAQFAHQYVAPRTATEAILAKIWAEVLGVDRVGIHDNFFELGGHSILLMQLVFRARTAFTFNLSPRNLFERPTVAGMAELIDKGAPNDLETVVSVDLKREALLDPTITPTLALVEPKHNPETVLLTGATGFLGAFLLHELLHQTPAKVYCLVRARSHAKAEERLRCCLMRYEIWDACLNDRILPIRGDLAISMLGLSTGEFQTLAEEVDVIYHNGALVNFVQPYAALRAANVLGTQEVLRLACTCKVKPVHYVSTLSVFGTESSPSPHGFSEDDFAGPNADLGNGYGQSKWVAEQLVRTAASRGLPVSVYRPATVTGHSRTGAWNTDDYLCRLIRACIEIGKAPEEESTFDVVPVDYVSKAITYLSRQPQSIGKTFHITNPQPLSSMRLIDWANALVHPIERIPYAQWREDVCAMAGQSIDHVLYPLLPLFQGEVPRHEERSRIPVQRYDHRQTFYALKGGNIRCPAPDEALWRIYFPYVLRNGSL